MALKLLLLLALEMNIRRIQVYGDSLVVINWAKGIQDCHIMRLNPILEEVHRIINEFEYVMFSHVYRELNRSVNFLSKEAARIQQGSWQIENIKGEGSYGYYHKPFHDI